MKVLIVTEFRPEHLGAGVRRRLDHYVDRYKATGAEVEVTSLFDEVGASFLRSVRAARAFGRSDRAARADEVLFVGVGSVPMLLGARARARRNAGVTVFDQCDSALTQVWTALSARHWRLIVFATLRLVFLITAGRRVVLDYISERDRRLDTVLHLRRITRLTPPTVPRELTGLPEVDPTRVDRLVIPGDFTSSHLARGLTALRHAAPDGLAVPVEYFGPLPPAWMLPRAVYRGFAQSITDLYSGNAVVFVPNVGGAGVPNKLYEASVSGRLVIAHRSIIDRISTPLHGWVWQTEQDLHAILDGLGKDGGPRSTRLR